MYNWRWYPVCIRICWVIEMTNSRPCHSNKVTECFLVSYSNKYEYLKEEQKFIRFLQDTHFGADQYNRTHGPPQRNPAIRNYYYVEARPIKARICPWEIFIGGNWLGRSEVVGESDWPSTYPWLGQDRSLFMWSRLGPSITYRNRMHYSICDWF